MTQKLLLAHHCTNLSCYVVATKACIDNRKKLLYSNIPSTSPHNMANFGLLTAEIGLGVCGTPAKFNGCRVSASLLQRRRSPEANQTLHDVWPSPALVHYIFIFGGSCLLTEFFRVQYSLSFASESCLLLYWQCYCTAGVSETLRRGTHRMELRNFRRGRHLYSAGRSSRWASAHILVLFFINWRCAKIYETRMWADAQRDGRPGEYRWRPLFNAAKFG